MYFTIDSLVQDQISIYIKFGDPPSLHDGVPDTCDIMVAVNPCLKKAAAVLSSFIMVGCHLVSYEAS